MSNVEKAQKLFGEFEKKCESLSGLDELSEAIEIVSHRKIDKLALLFSKIAKSKINAISRRPREHKPETFEFWEQVANCFTPFGDEFIIMRDKLTKLKGAAYWDALPERTQLEKLAAGIRALPEDKRKEVLALLKSKSNGTADDGSL